MSRVHRLFGVFVLFAMMIPLGTIAGQVQAATPAVQGSPEVRPATHHDTSPPLRDIPSIPPSSTTPRERPILPIPTNGADSKRPDTAAQTTITAPRVAATELLNMDGLSAGAAGTHAYAPPDTNGAVGATQYVEWTNVAFAVYDKATGALALGFPKAGNTLWSGFGGGCETNNDGDPIVQYDKAARRWVLTQFSVSTLPYLECVAVSTTSDATGTYNRYAFDYGSIQLPDYPKLGVWPDGYYISYNIFNNGQTWAGAKVCTLDRVRMLAGANATQQCFQLTTSYGGLLPADLDGAAAPPLGTPNTFLNFGANALNLWQFHVDWAAPANTTLTGPTSIPVAPFTAAKCSGSTTCVPQSGTAQRLDTLGDRLMYRLAYRQFADHASLVVNHTVYLDGTGSTYRTGVRWYELRVPNGGSAALFQQGTYAPADGVSRWMGSIAMDRAGDIAVGYSASSSAIYPDIRYTGRAPGDALGTLQGEATLIAGGGSQQLYLKRWGDYSSMSIDPVDDCTFWFTSEYLQTSGTHNWHTRIGSFQLPGGCGAPTPVDALSASSLTFPAQPVGTTSAGQTVTLTNTGQAPLAISSLRTSGDYTQSNDCPASLASSARCSITVRFTPTAAGNRAGTLTITDNAPGSPHLVTLNGVGTQPAPPPAPAPAPPPAPAPAPAPQPVSWSPWNSLGGVLTDAPAAAGFNGRVYVFAKGSDNALYVKSSADGVTFSGWQNLGGILTAAPAAASVNGQLYVFAKGSDNALYVESSADGSSWSGWRSLGGILTAPPAAAGVNGVLYVFAKGSDNALYLTRSTDGLTWSGWQNLGGILTAAPAATGFQNQVWVFAKGSDNALYEMHAPDGVTFTGWANYGGVLTAAPAAASYRQAGGAELLYTFAKGTDNTLYERHTSDGATWTDWRSLGGQLIGPPAAAGVNGQLFTFAWWRDNTLDERHILP